MDINEILTRPSPANYTVEELQFAVEQYILKKKGIQVQVNVYKGMPEDGILNQFQIMELHLEYQNLMSAFQDVQLNYNR